MACLTRLRATIQPNISKVFTKNSSAYFKARRMIQRAYSLLSMLFNS